MRASASVFDRVFAKSRPWWIKLLISLILLLIPFGVAKMEGVLQSFIYEGHWRVCLLAPTIVLYIWFTAPVMFRMGEQADQNIRILIQLNQEDLQQLINRYLRIRPWQELVAFGIGTFIGFLTSQAITFDQDLPGLIIYWYISSMIMYGILAWTIYLSTITTRLNNALFRQPLKFDIFNITPFEAVGRQSLFLSLLFIGGITLSLIFSFQMQSLVDLRFWISYLATLLIAALIFLLNMLPTHRVIAAEKKRELDRVQAHIHIACHALIDRLDHQSETGDLPAQIHALTLYEQSLQAARTWPYNTQIIRTLFFSVLVPLGTGVARLINDVVFK